MQEDDPQIGKGAAVVNSATCAAVYGPAIAPCWQSPEEQAFPNEGDASKTVRSPTFAVHILFIIFGVPNLLLCAKNLTNSTSVLGFCVKNLTIPLQFRGASIIPQLFAFLLFIHNDLCDSREPRAQTSAHEGQLSNKTRTYSALSPSRESSLSCAFSHKKNARGWRRILSKLERWILAPAAAWREGNLPGRFRY